MIRIYLINYNKLIWYFSFEEEEEEEKNQLNSELKKVDQEEEEEGKYFFETLCSKREYLYYESIQSQSALGVNKQIVQCGSAVPESSHPKSGRERRAHGNKRQQR